MSKPKLGGLLTKTLLSFPSFHNPNCIASSLHLLLPLLRSSVLGGRALKVLLAMEAALKLKLFAMAVVMAASMVQTAAAAQAPAPSPTSGAPTSSTAAALASVAALAFGYLLC
ncbi:hypothetical protein OPV22_012732 [Ensete ventricosum]|uniref:Uncharacterized protein n=1 Tax=Ensete ventricosum TaxID=4639 RepID=A0AAV8R870_ENSVE|nr:hypothetical protein OPV22_012732 [Ensete ventricosum]